MIVSWQQHEVRESNANRYIYLHILTYVHINTWHLCLKSNMWPEILRQIGASIYAYLYVYTSIHATSTEQQHVARDCEADQYIYIYILTNIHIHTWHLYLNSNIGPEILRQIGAFMYTYLYVYTFIHDTSILAATCGQRLWDRPVHLYSHSYMYIHT